MKSIVDTLAVIKNAVTEFERETKNQALAALIGGYAVIFYGVERTTLDIDICFYSEEAKPGASFFAFIKKHLPDRFKPHFIEASKDPTDPLKHDLIIIDDTKREYPRIDILVARYKWELEGLMNAKMGGELSFPIMPLPYLLAMKLRADSRKDELDVVEMLKEMSKKEVEKAKELAKKSGRDRKLRMLLKEIEK